MSVVRAASDDARARAQEISAAAASAESSGIWFVHLAQIVGGLLALFAAGMPAISWIAASLSRSAF